MSKVKRWMPFDIEAGMYEHQNGAYVIYTDYAALVAENTKLRKVVDMMPKGCTCDYGIGHPSYSKHSDVCRKRTEALAKLEKVEEVEKENV